MDSIAFFDEEKVSGLISMADLIPTMKQALIDFSAGRVVQPVRQFVNVDEHHGFFGMMPAVAGDMGIKLVTFYPGNAERKMHTHHALILLFRVETGEPLAVMDGRLITEMRTAATSAAATDLLSMPNSRVLAILGSGVQARSHWEAMRLVRDFDEVRVWSRDPGHARDFAREIGATAMSAEDAVRGADVVVTATAAVEPILLGAWLKPGAHVNAVGWNGPDARELDDAAMANAVFVESRDAAADQAGNVRGSGCTITAEIGAALAGEIEVSPEQTTIFDSVGMAIEDIAAAGLVWRKAAG
jgi:ornithine cyclodeaminase/alanine dehydrogenase-like protein (mu-crystallin family)